MSEGGSESGDETKRRRRDSDADSPAAAGDKEKRRKKQRYLRLFLFFAGNDRQDLSTVSAWAYMILCWLIC